MSDPLDIHAASPDELVAAHKNVFDIWSKGRSLEEHLDYRLNAPQHRRATWYVGCADGVVATSLGAYPVRFQVYGEEIPGFAIGSVYTRDDFRGRGFAPQLITEVERLEADRGRRMSILYSDVDQGYYAAMGYQLCPAPEGWRNLAREPVSTAHEQLVEFQETDDFDAMSRMYHAYHGGVPFSFLRDADYWRAMSSKFPDDRFFWLKDAGGQNRAYVRLTPDPHGWRILDYACGDQQDATLADLYRALSALTASWQAERFGGWVPNSPAAAEFFEVSDRETEITMIKSLDSELVLDEAVIQAAGRFCEMDHV